MSSVKKCKCGEFKNRGLAVDSVVVKDNRVLLIKRSNDPEKGSWALPGGFVDWGETVEEACERELNEETGLQATRMKILGIYSSPKRYAERISITYLVEANGEIEAGDDAVDIKWFSLDRLPANLLSDHKDILADIVSAYK